MFKMHPVAKLKQLKEALEGPGAKGFCDAIDEIVASLEAPCPFMIAVMDFAHAPAEAGEGPTDRLMELAKIDDGSRPATPSICPDGREGCMVFHGTPATIGFEEALRTRPRMYGQFLKPLLLGRPVQFVKPGGYVKDMHVSGQVVIQVDGDWPTGKIIDVEVTD